MFKKIKKLFDKIDQMAIDGMVEMGNDFSDENSKFRCPFCGAFMPMFKMVVIAKSYKVGEKYTIKCRSCKKDVILTKGKPMNKQGD